jgi:hypothetical protein
MSFSSSYEILHLNYMKVFTYSSIMLSTAVLPLTETCPYLDLREIGIVGANWIQLAQDRVQWRAFLNTVMNFQVP